MKFEGLIVRFMIEEDKRKSKAKTGRCKMEENASLAESSSSKKMKVTITAEKAKKAKGDCYNYIWEAKSHCKRLPSSLKGTNEPYQCCRRKELE